MEGEVELLRGQQRHSVRVGLAQSGTILSAGVMLDDSAHGSSDLLMSLAYGLPPARRGLVRKDPGIALWTFPPDYIDRLRGALLKQQ